MLHGSTERNTMAKKKRPSIISGQSDRQPKYYTTGGHSPLHIRQTAGAAKKKAKNIGNALLPGNPFG